MFEYHLVSVLPGDEPLADAFECNVELSSYGLCSCITGAVKATVKDQVGFVAQ